MEARRGHCLVGAARVSGRQFDASANPVERLLLIGLTLTMEFG